WNGSRAVAAGTGSGLRARADRQRPGSDRPGAPGGAGPPGGAGVGVGLRGAVGGADPAELPPGPAHADASLRDRTGLTPALSTPRQFRESIRQGAAPRICSVPPWSSLVRPESTIEGWLAMTVSRWLGWLDAVPGLGGRKQRGARPLSRRSRLRLEALE